MGHPDSRRFHFFAVGTLGYTIATILWGAWVRITGSGAGCGSHWPTCNGQLIPRSPTAETLIEYSHRLTSGLTLVLSVTLFVWAMRRFGRKSLVGKGAAGTLFFVLAEAALGAGLVLFELVAENDSVARAVVVAFHLVNTFGLVGFGTLTIWAASGKSLSPATAPWKKWVYPYTALLLLVGMTGAITALGDTLFPVDIRNSLLERLQADLSPGEHFLVKLRYIHPLLSIATGSGLVITLLLSMRGDREPAATAVAVILFVLCQFLLGWLNVELGAPGWMQLLHLLMADLLWISFVWHALEARRASGDHGALSSGTSGLPFGIERDL